MTETLFGRHIEIAWPDLGITVTAELDDRNTVLADALWETLPYQSLQGHALMAGCHLYHVAPIPSLLHLPASHRFDRREAPDGTVTRDRVRLPGRPTSPAVPSGTRVKLSARWSSTGSPGVSAKTPRICRFPAARLFPEPPVSSSISSTYSAMT